MLTGTLAALKADVSQAVGLDALVSPEGITPPVAVVVPADPWLTGAETFQSKQAHYLVQVVAASAAENTTTLDELSGYVDDLVANLPPEWVVGDVSAPFAAAVGGSSYATVTVPISTTLDQ